MSQTELFPDISKIDSFLNYYEVRSNEGRLDCIPKDLLQQIDVSKNIVILDIGCNTGELTCEIYKHLTITVDERDKKNTVNVIAVDIDPILIQHANAANALPQHIVYRLADITDDSQRWIFMEMLKLYDKQAFDIVCCFSTTMWIHLTHGDAGLLSFLRNVSSMTKYLLIEPQNWESYQYVAKNVCKKKCPLLENIEKLSITENVVEHIINFLQKECKMELFQQFGESKWKREIMLFKKHSN